ncbi:MAG: helix-turn-helix transcriptional regulator [Coriobacteriales bacterium]|nr:helix-turn-helix transcriptional regulator [Coriobacteriales bacterium]
MSLVKGFAGAVLVWGWLLAVVWCASLLAQTSIAGFSEIGLYICVGSSLVLGGIGLWCTRKFAHRGPEFNRYAMITIAGIAALMVAVAYFVSSFTIDQTISDSMESTIETPGISFYTVLVYTGWFILGIGAVYALRRTHHLLLAYAEYVNDTQGALRAVLCLLLASAFLCWAISHMDTVGALVTTLLCIPGALALLAQGKLVLGNRKSNTGEIPVLTAPESGAYKDGQITVSPAEVRPVQIQVKPETPVASAPNDNLNQEIPGADTPADILSAESPMVREVNVRQARAAHFNQLAVRYGLSEREHDLLFLLAEGLNAQQIAERVYVSRNTAKTHIAHIYNKFGIHSRSELDELLKLPQ